MGSPIGQNMRLNMAIPDVVINYWAVLVTGLVGFFIGMIWYSPAVFGNLWMNWSGLNPNKAKSMKKKSMAGFLVLALIGSLLMAFVLAHFVQYLTVTSFNDVLRLAFLVWLGFTAPITVGMVLWQGKPWKLWFLMESHNLLVFIIMTWILSSW